jgi:hypothetical protein
MFMKPSIHEIWKKEEIRLPIQRQKENGLGKTAKRVLEIFRRI